MPVAVNTWDSRPLNQQSNVLGLLQELGVLANSSLSVGTALHMSLGAIGSYTGWPIGRVKLDDADVALVGGPSVIWRNSVWSEPPPADAWPQPSFPDDQASVVAAALPSTGELSSLSGYVGCPVYSGPARVGTLEFLTHEPPQLDPLLRQVLGHAATLVSLVIERGRVQAGLRESERRFQAIFDQSYQFIGLMEPDGTLIEANQTAVQFAGITLEDVVGKPFWETYWWQISPATQEQLKAAIARAAAGELVHYDVEVQGAGGQVVTIDFSIKPIRDLNGHVVLLIPEGRDITDLRHTLESLQRTEARLAEAQQVARMGHWDYDVATQEAFWSDTLYTVFGLQREAVTDPGKEFLDRVHPDDLPELRLEMERAYRQHTSYEVSYRIIQPDGGVRAVYGAGNVTTNDAGEVTRMSGIVQDISRRQQLEESLARSVTRLSSVNNVGQIVAASQDLGQIYREVLAAARALLGADMVLLFEYDQEALHVRAADHDGTARIGRLSIPANAGVAGEVWTTGRAVWLSGDECRRRRSGRLAQLVDYEPRAMVTVPVRWQDQIVGVLQAVDRRDDAFDLEDLNTLQAVGTWTAIAIGKARQHAALERRLREGEAVAHISRALSGTLEPQSILDLIAATAQSVVPHTDWTVIHLLRGRPERLFPVAAAGSAPPADEYVIASNQGIAGHVLLAGHLINVGDVREDDRASEFARAVGVRSMLVAPIQSRNRAIGTISSVSRQPHTFTAEDEHLITILASQAALAIENAQLFDSQRRARAVAELQRERLRELTQRIVSAQEEERLRISRELHDEAGQALTSLKISLDLIRVGLPAEQEALRARLAGVAALADETMETLRTLAHDLRPPGLDAFGLNVALEGLCYDFGARTQLPVTYRGLELPELPTAVALSMYRLVQEALTNIAKHADARQAQVELTRDDGYLCVDVVDDGKGFVPETEAEDPRRRGGIGLVSMRERAELLGGTLQIETSPGQGTRLTARIPLEQEVAGEGS
jgi:PAS domain S-box-containing protein